ncbi:hypothetical protein HW132_29875 [Brasilonema sp. CT11]|nr:hypothetical protein [Brasilonema sp. CT11]
MRGLKSTVIGVALFSIAATVASPAQAITFVTERTDLQSNDQVDWSSLGQIFNPLSPNTAAFLPNSFSAKSEGGLGLNVNIPLSTVPGVTPPFVFQTLFPPNGIPTNFEKGDFVLLTGLQARSFPAVGNPGPITITFDKPVTGGGTQVAVDDTPNFTAFISAFDNANNLLGTFSVPGISSGALDNSAIFLGVSSDIPNIKRLVFSSSEPNRALGINSLSVAVVSEPTFTLSLLAFGALGTCFTRRRKLNKLG